jgi:hypothetical protein
LIDSTQNWAGGVAQVEEALSSNSSTAKKKNKNKKHRFHAFLCHEQSGGRGESEITIMSGFWLFLAALVHPRASQAQVAMCG